MKKILLLSALLLGMGIANVTIAQQKAPLPKKGSDQVVPDYKKPKTVVAPKSDKPTNAPKTGEVKSAQGGAAAPSTVKPGKGSVQMVPDYKKPKTVVAPKSDKPTHAPKTGEVKGGTKPTKDKPSLPKDATPISTPQKTRGGAVDPKTTGTKGQQGPKPGKGSVQMVPDYKKPKTVGIPKSGKPISAPKTGEVKGGTKPTGGIKPAPSTGKPTGGIKPAPSTGKPTGGIKPAPSAGKPVSLTPKDDKVTKATVEVKGKGKGSVPMVPDYKQAAKKPK